MDEVIEDRWNFKPLLSTKEDIDFLKVQQFEEYMFQIYNSLLDSFSRFKSKQSWCQKAMEEIKMQENGSNILKNYAFSLNEISGEDSSRSLIRQFKLSIQKCREILIKFEAAVRHNKQTPLHEGFQKKEMRYLADIYIKEEEMLKYRDSKREELKDIEKQVGIFEKLVNSVEDSEAISSINLGSGKLEEVTSLQSQFNPIQDRFLLTWSIISSMSEDIKLFHKNLRIIESINSSDDDKFDAQCFLSDYENHELKIESYKQLKLQMEEHHQKIDVYLSS